MGTAGLGAGDEVEVRAWRVQDTGLAPAPGRFRRLPGRLRHHTAPGAAWPDAVTLRLTSRELVVEGLGSWPRSDVRSAVLHDGPPLTFVLEVPGGSHLLAAPADAATRALLQGLT